MTTIGHIYKIICRTDESFCYIGSTFNRLSKRFETHRSAFNRWLEGKVQPCSCFPYFEKHGIENFKIVLIKDYEVCRAHVKDRRHLEAYETLWICRTKCVNKCVPVNYLKKERNRENQRRFYAANIEVIKAKAREKFDCKCGGRYARDTKRRHERSQKHQRWVEQNQ